MESHVFLIQLVMILISARVCGEIASRLQAPPVIGELLAGVLIGPSLLNWVQASHSVELLAEIGIILLLFEVGLETDVGRMIRAGAKAGVVAITGVVLPFVLGFALSYYVFDFSLLASLFIGSTLTATSIGITVRVLRDLGRQNSTEAQVILGAAVIDDIIGIVLLSILYEFSMSGEVNILNTGRVLLFIGIYFVASPLAARGITDIIHMWDKKSAIPGVVPTMIVSLILFFSWLAHLVGAPELLGGFAAGLALSKQFISPFTPDTDDTRNFTNRVHDQMLPIIHLFAPIFFVSIGLSLNLREIEWNSPFIWTLSLSMLAVAIISKLASGFFLKRTSLFFKLAVGTSMIPRGEVGLIFAGIAVSSNVFNNELYAAMIIVIAITTLLPPFALRWLYTRQEE